MGYNAGTNTLCDSINWNFTFENRSSSKSYVFIYLIQIPQMNHHIDLLLSLSSRFDKIESIIKAQLAYGNVFMSAVFHYVLYTVKI